MQKLGISLIVLLGGISTVVLAEEAQQCALNSTCSFTVRGKFSKEFITPRIEKGKDYICSVSRGPGHLLSINSIYASPGISYELKGLRFNRSFIIHGAQNEAGYIRYTFTNNNDPWRRDAIQFSCRLLK